MAHDQPDDAPQYPTLRRKNPPYPLLTHGYLGRSSAHAPPTEGDSMTTNYQNDLGGSPDTGSDSSPGAKDRAQQAAGTAAEETKHVAGVAQEEAAKVAAEAKDQLRGLLGDATHQVDEQSRAQKSRLTETLRTFGDDLDGMAQQQDGSGPATQLVQQVAQQAKGLASHLEDREPQDLIEDVRRYARRRPGTFLLGAVVAGVVVGRLTRGAKAAKDEQGGSHQDSGTVEPTLAGGRAPVTTAPRTVGTVSPTPVVTDPGYAPEPVEPFGAPGPGRDALVDPLDPLDPPHGGSPTGRGPA